MTDVPGNCLLQFISFSQYNCTKGDERMGFFFPIREQLSRQNLCLKQIIKKTNKTATTTKPENVLR